MSGSSGCSVPRGTASGRRAAVSATQRLRSRAMPGLCAYVKKQKRSTLRARRVATTASTSNGCAATQPRAAKCRSMARPRRSGCRWTWTSMQGKPGSNTLRELDAPCPDPVLRDRVAHGAPAMLDDRYHARHAIAEALAAHDEDGVGGGADVARRHLASEQIFEPRLLRRHEE